AYMSPEQCRGDVITAASDQYSLGTVAPELLAGVPPFRGPTLMVLQAHSGEAPKKLSETRPECPPALAAVVERMLAKDPDERWDGMAEVSSELRKAIGELAPPQALQAWAKRVREIGVEPTPTPLTLGTSERLVARLLDGEGEELLGRRVHWASTDGGVASVTAEGVLGARGVGSAVIVGRSGAAVATFEVEVVPERVAAVSISADGGPMQVGDERTASCSIAGADGSQFADRTVSWSSSDTAVIEVDDTGKITAASEGSAVLTASCEGVSDSVTLDVVRAKAASDHTQVIHGIDWGPPQDLRPPVTSEAPAFGAMPELAEPPTPPDQPKDDRTRVMAAGTPAAAPPPPPLAAPDKTNVIRPGDLAAAQAEVDGAVPSTGSRPASRDLKDLVPAGVLPRVAIGAGGLFVLFLLVRLVGGGGPELPLLALSVLPADTSVEVGDQFRLRAGVSAADLRARNPVWTSSDPGVAMVSEAGVVEAVGPGSAALSLRGDGLETNGPWALTVVPAGALAAADAGADTLVEGGSPATPETGGEVAASEDSPPESRPVPQEQQVDPAPPPPRPEPRVPVPTRLIVESVNRELDVGQGRPLNVTVVDQDGRAVAPDNLAWISSSPDAVAVDGEGTAIGVSAGSAWIIATQGSLRDSVEMTVAAPEVVEEEPAPVSLSSGPNSSEAASLVAQFVAALGGDPNSVLALIPVGERANHERFVTYVSEGRLEANGAAQDLTVNGASARFTLPVEGRTAFGGRRGGTMSFIAEFTAEGGAWTLTRVVPAPGSTPP
ncbi:MAG: Ig-like domain-containing protein, partial [Longimicrobiales bacterium]